MFHNLVKLYSMKLRQDKYCMVVLRVAASLLLLGGMLLISASVFLALRLWCFDVLNHSY
jgi:hypothetical protein